MKPLFKPFMKRSIILLFAMSFCIILYGQTDIPIQRENGKFILLYKKSLKLDSEYRISFSGINPAHHIIKVTAKSFELQSPQPEAFKDILFLSNSLPPTGLSKLKKIFPPESSSDKGAYDLEIDRYKSEIADYKEELRRKMEKLNKLKEIADELHKVTDESPNEEKAKNAESQLLETYSKKSLPEVLETVGSDIHYINSSVTYLQAYLSNIDVINTEVASLLTLAQYQVDALKSRNYLEFLNYIIASRNIKNYKVNYICSEPFETKKDLTEVRVILIDRYSKDTLYNNNRTFYNKGGWGIGFSTGFFYTHKLTDDSYYLQKREDGNMGIKEEDKWHSDLSIGAFTHFYYKIDKMWRIGPGLGITVSPLDAKPRYLLGLSALFGKEKMVGISAGMAWAKVKQISASVKSDKDGLYLAPDATAVPTFDKVRNNFFIGITYNLVSTRK